MNEIMREYKICPNCNHPWVSSHFQGEDPCLCVECGCHWSITIKVFHSLADDMKNRKGKPPELGTIPMPERGRIEEKAREPVTAGHFWIWFIVGIILVLMCVKLVRKDEERLSLEQRIEEQEQIERVLRIIEEGSYDEIPDYLERRGRNANRRKD